MRYLILIVFVITSCMPTDSDIEEAKKKEPRFNSEGKPTPTYKRLDSLKKSVPDYNKQYIGPPNKY